MSTTATETDLSVANEIARQMGGAGRIRLMTGAKHIMGDKDSLTIVLPERMAKGGINRIRVRLDADDTYTMTFWKIGRGVAGKVTVVKEVAMVYCDQLIDIFESTTAVYLRM